MAPFSLQKYHLASVFILAGQINDQPQDPGYHIITYYRQYEENTPYPYILSKELEYPACQETTDIEQDQSFAKLPHPFDPQSCLYHHNICQTMKQYEFHRRIRNRQRYDQTGKERPGQSPKTDTSVGDPAPQQLTDHRKKKIIHRNIDQKEYVYV